MIRVPRILKRNSNVYFFISLLVPVACVVNFLITCFVSGIQKDKERQRHFSSVILDINVTMWVIAFSLKEAINKFIKC